MLSIGGLSIDSGFSNSIMVGVFHMLFKSGFEGSSYLSYVGHSTEERDLIDSEAKNGAILVFGQAEELTKGFLGFEQHFEVPFIKAFGNMIGNSLSIGNGDFG